MPSDWQRFKERARSHTAAQRSRDRLRAEGSHVCCLCGRPIDMALPVNDQWSWTLEHQPALVYLFQIGADPNDPVYHREAHRTCNSSKGMRDIYAPKGKRTY